jgi:very-short-patch-repair endonuclease
MRGKVEPAATAIARIASSQHGVVTRAELLEAGVTKGVIEARLSSGALLPEYRGVYRVGHRAPSTEAIYMAAVKAGGPGALLAGRAAAHLLGILKGPPPEPTVITPKPRRVRGLRTRTSRGLGRRDGTVVRSIPVTTVPSTLVDCSSLLSLPDLARACHEAGVRYGTTPRQVEAVLRRRPNAPGATNLRKVLSGEQRVTLSALERTFLERLEEAGLPLPETNRPAGGRRVDCRWPEHRLTVELDSYRYHRSRHAWEQDRRRDREAHARGDQIRRYTHDDVLDDPTLMLSELQALLPRSPRQSKRGGRVGR